LKVLLIHGIGGHPPGGGWAEDWLRAAREGLLAGEELEAATCL
jgi:hypothetical protein